MKEFEAQLEVSVRKLEEEKQALDQRRQALEQQEAKLALRKQSLRSIASTVRVALSAHTKAPLTCDLDGRIVREPARKALSARTAPGAAGTQPG